MKMAMTALAVVLLAPAALFAASPAMAQDQPDRPGTADHDRPHRDGERGGQPPRPAVTQPTPSPTPSAPTPSAPPPGARGGGGHWNPGAGGYPGRGGTWTPGGAPPVVQPTTPPPQARVPDHPPSDRFNGGRNDGGRTDGRRNDAGRRDGDRFNGGPGNPDWRGGDQHDRDRGQDRDRHDGDRRDGDRGVDRRDGDRRDGDRRDWGRYEGDTRSWGRYDWDRRWEGHEDRPRWDRGRYPPVYVSPHRYRGYRWRAPPGYYVRAWAFGDFLPRGWYGPDWFIEDPWELDLPLPPPGFDWVRVGYDAIMIDDYTGRVVQVVRNVFW